MEEILAKEEEHADDMSTLLAHVGKRKVAVEDARSKPESYWLLAGRDHGGTMPFIRAYAIDWPMCSLT